MKKKKQHTKNQIVWQTLSRGLEFTVSVIGYLVSSCVIWGCMSKELSAWYALLGPTWDF